MTEYVRINDVSLRDGLQNLPIIVPLSGKLRLFDALRASGLSSFEVTSFVSPRAVPQLADAEALMQALPEAPDVTFDVLVPNVRGYERAKEARVRRIALVVAATESLNRANFDMSINEGVRVSLEVLGRARADGIHARAYVAASMRCSYEGDVDPKIVLQLAGRLLEGGAQDIAIADTVGGGGPQIARTLFRQMVSAFGAANLSAHLHDTRGLGSTLAFIALESGIRRFDACIGGLGGCPFAPGAAGNIATEDLVLLLNESGMETGIDIDALMRAVDVAEEIVRQPIGGRMRRWWNATSPEKRYIGRPLAGEWHSSRKDDQP